MEVLKINGHDYTKYIKTKGMSWARNDLDSESAGRTMDGTMHRSKVDTKRTVGFKLVNVPRSILAQLDDDLSAETFSATYLDLHGVSTRTFYCSNSSGNLNTVYEDGGSEWGDATFNMIEV